MKIGCRDLERTLRDGDAAALAAVEPPRLAAIVDHARECASCRRELEAWKRISSAASGLKKTWDSPELWPRIERALAEESRRRASESAPERPAGVWRWLPAAAIVALFAVAAAGLWVFRNTAGRDPLTSHWQTKKPLLTEQAVEEVETAEKAYLASIDRLSRLAEPRLADTSSPLVLSYREKLDLLDSAIAELKSSIDQNRFNTHLRKELLAVYGEKQRTLQNLMKEARS
jgi:hypothetical protein